MKATQSAESTVPMDIVLRNSRLMSKILARKKWAVQDTRKRKRAKKPRTASPIQSMVERQLKGTLTEWLAISRPSLGELVFGKNDAVRRFVAFIEGTHPRPPQEYPLSIHTLEQLAPLESWGWQKRKSAV